MNKHQVIGLWVGTVAFSVIAFMVVTNWQQGKYPFHFFLVSSLPVIVISALLFLTLGKIEKPKQQWGVIIIFAIIITIFLFVVSANLPYNVGTWKRGW